MKDKLSGKVNSAPDAFEKELVATLDSKMYFSATTQGGIKGKIIGYFADPIKPLYIVEDEFGSNHLVPVTELKIEG